MTEQAAGATLLSFPSFQVLCASQLLFFKFLADIFLSSVTKQLGMATRTLLLSYATQLL